MKRIVTVCVAIAASLFISSNANAQQVKIGFFDEQQILALMPGIGKVDTMLQKFAQDSIAPEREALMDELKQTDSLLKDSSKLGASLKQVLQKKAQEAFYKLQNWQQYQQQMMQAKQEQLLAPFKKPIFNALQDVIAEQKYTIVLKPEAAIYADKSDDLPLRVIAKLKIPNLPQQLQDQINAVIGKATTGPSTTPAPTKPTSKPKGKG